MKVLVVGGGGREHVLAWKFAQSSQVEKVYCVPGNPGIEAVAECVKLERTDPDSLADFAHKEGVDLTVVGPEAALVDGIADVFSERGLLLCGPSREAARLEGSKAFAKEFMGRNGIPTARYQLCTSVEGAREIIESWQWDWPVVVKADGLAAGKGVILVDDQQSVLETVKQMIEEGAFGEAGRKVVIEECLKGEEASFMLVCDGERTIPLATSQDHKRLLDEDHGPNTGGMGAYSPTPRIDSALASQIHKTIVEPTIAGMAREGNPFRGLLYVGLMLTEQGPKVLEYNVRFGDPEAQAVLPRLESDLAVLLYDAASGSLPESELEWKPGSCACVVVASGGYPGSVDKGHPIDGLVEAESEGAIVFHAGTGKDSSGNLINSGGRVLGVCAVGDSLREALHSAYGGVRQIHFENMQFRKDIGKRAL